MAGMELMKYNVKRQNEQLIKIIHDGFPANDQVQTQLEALLNKKTNWIKKTQRCMDKSKATCAHRAVYKDNVQTEVC